MIEWKNKYRLMYEQKFLAHNFYELNNLMLVECKNNIFFFANHVSYFQTE